MLYLNLQRKMTNKNGTQGLIILPSGEKIFTLEPFAFKNNYPCIPAGDYTVVMRFSAKFQQLMPTLLDVPGRRGILIHTGNTYKDTKGCILVGGGR